MGMSMAKQEADILKRGIKKVINEIELEMQNNSKSPNIGNKGCVNRLYKILSDAEKIYDWKY